MLKQHTIGHNLNRGFYYQSRAICHFFSSYGAAKEYAKRKRTEPSRFSLDHPDNASALRGGLWGPA